MTVKKLDYEDLQERTYRAIKELMLKGELRANEKLRQEALAKRLGVSRTPLLRAFSKLEKDLFVVSVPRRGVYVRQFTTEELINIYDIRLRLEPLGALQAAERSTPEAMRQLEERARAFAEAIAANDVENIRAVDYELHMEVMRQSGNALLVDILSSFNIILISNIKGLQKAPEKSLAEHALLLQAIGRRDAAEAERIMYDHILEARENLRRAATAGAVESGIEGNR